MIGIDSVCSLWNQNAHENTALKEHIVEKALIYQLRLFGVFLPSNLSRVITSVWVVLGLLDVPAIITRDVQFYYNKLDKYNVNVYK